MYNYCTTTYHKIFLKQMACHTSARCNSTPLIFLRASHQRLLPREAGKSKVAQVYFIREIVYSIRGGKYILTTKYPGLGYFIRASKKVGNLPFFHNTDTLWLKLARYSCPHPFPLPHGLSFLRLCSSRRLYGCSVTPLVCTCTLIYTHHSL